MKTRAKWVMACLALGLAGVGSAVIAAPRGAYVPPTPQVQQALAFNPFNLAAPAPVVTAAPAAVVAVKAVPAPRPPYLPPPRSPFLPNPVGPLLP